MERPAPINTAENPIKIIESGMESAIDPSPIFVTKPRDQIVSASLTNTSPLLNFGSTLDIAAKKTTASAAVVACRGVKSNM